MARLLPHSIVTLALAALLAACGSSEDADGLPVVTIAAPESIFEDGLRLSPGAQMVRDATSSGIVALNAEGEVVPALGESWIVTEDGRSFIFRLRQVTWPDGEPLTAQEARTSLLDTIRELRGTSLGLDLRKVDEIRAMTNRVIEIRLTGPMPEFLQLLAQPELAITRDGESIGPMRLTREGAVAVLEPTEPEEIGLPEMEDEVRGMTLRLRAMGGEDANRAFAAGQAAALLDGTIFTLPLADTGPLSRGTIRLDPALGLFGMVVTNDQGFLAEAENREAISMAIDRPALLEQFSVGGWQPSAQIVPRNLPSEAGALTERWPGLSLDARREQARTRVTEWSRATGQEARLRLWLPDGPGSDRLMNALSLDLAAIGVELRRVQFAEGADLVMIDRTARYPSARWFLNQFNCALLPGPCSPDADSLVTQSLFAANADEAANLLVEAEGALIAQEAYIPLGAPVRWSLVRSGLEGFSENPWARHPLSALAGVELW
ncbi:ABC transporter substrate-binding protein [Alteriqipengyuania lutimaris]|uniref:Peptide ABC transporter substrate-binding protein n=1 Tax=Alteriqipengyuania lutimaris TaxID=1538146 RepID=A0A395LHX9_9SPHN|nr:ABC transporter substrate-binding protein [Alteriqipengyuania lutimaris]MBB3034570.1 ABC-type transport system substrate-binding protein [Alteriqipengyuania lutimaris]RDS76548.1 peptide ABC transporter substrate-binding protein [Alteriqipengyuania lutimaris]